MNDKKEKVQLILDKAIDKLFSASSTILLNVKSFKCPNLPLKICGAQAQS